MKDTTVPPPHQIALARHFEKKGVRFVEHQGGHIVPQQAKYTKIVEDFISNCMMNN